MMRNKKKIIVVHLI